MPTCSYAYVYILDSKWFKIKPTLRPFIREMASNGLTVAQIADCLGVSQSTLYGKQNEYKEFMDAIKKGRAEGLNKVSNALFEKATQGNVTAMIYYLKVRDRENWGENQPEPLREIPPMQIVLTGVSN